MPVYEYIALDPQGRKRKGIVEAASQTAARQKLRETDLVYPVELVEAALGNPKSHFYQKNLSGVFARIGLKDLVIVTRQLSTLVGAGLPLVSTLTVLISQTGNPLFKTILAQIKNSLNEGNSLTVSMSNFPKVFPPFYVNMVMAGEASGTLSVILGRLADFYENQQALKMKIRSAMAYPVLMFLIGGVVLLFLVSFIVPSITKMFQEMHQQLPAITVFLITVSEFLKSSWWLVITVLALLSGGSRYLVRNTPWGRYRWDSLKLHLPLIGPLNGKMAVARFSRTLGTLLQSDVPLLKSLEIVRNVVNNRLIADVIQTTANEVREGKSISLQLARSEFFPPMAIEMISVGEQSGALETMLFKIADAFEKESEANILLITTLLEPIMILTMGLLVGFIVISILLPIFEMNQLIR